MMMPYHSIIDAPAGESTLSFFTQIRIALPNSINCSKAQHVLLRHSTFPAQCRFIHCEKAGRGLTFMSSTSVHSSMEKNYIAFNHVTFTSAWIVIQEIYSARHIVSYNWKCVQKSHLPWSGAAEGKEGSGWVTTFGVLERQNYPWLQKHPDGTTYVRMLCSLYRW